MQSLNFAEGGNINKAVKTGTVTRLPFTMKFKGTTGSVWIRKPLLKSVKVIQISLKIQM